MLGSADFVRCRSGLGLGFWRHLYLVDVAHWAKACGELQASKGLFIMLSGMESSTPVVQISTPVGANAETCALQVRPLDSDLEPAVRVSACPVSLLKAHLASICAHM